MTVLVVKNTEREGPGLIEGVLSNNGVNYRVVDFTDGVHFPDPAEYSALIVLGGPDSANDKTPKIIYELNRIREAVGEVPYLGICLGMQTLVKAKGGRVCKNHIREMGFRDPEGDYFEIELTEEGRKDPLFTGLESPLKVFHLHGEGVVLEPEMTLLATGKYCTNQVVRVCGNAYGIQGHLELTDHMFEQWLAQDPWLQDLNTDALRKDYKTIREEYEKTGRQMTENFLRIARLL